MFPCLVRIRIDRLLGRRVRCRGYFGDRLGPRRCLGLVLFSGMGGGFEPPAAMVMR